MTSALVVGGTGPTGPHVVRGLLDRGYRVTILHTGQHERPEIADLVEHVHTDPFDGAGVDDVLGRRTFDAGIVMYGRLRDLAPVIGGRVGKLITIGGMPALLGYGHPEALTPPGLPVPTYEDDGFVDTGGEPANEKVARIVETEQATFRARPTATHFRYPLVYGPHQLLPREWMVVRRVLDGRRRIILPDGGLQVRSAVHAANAAHALLLALDHPDASAGRIYHVSDERTPTLRQVVEIVAAALGHRFEIVNLPYALATPAHPLTMLTGTFHRYTPSTALTRDLGYHDVVPCEEGLAQTAQWLAGNRPEPDGSIERALQDPFDYAGEDALLDAWDAARGVLEAAADNADPIYADRYSPDYEAIRVRRRARRARALED
jgi:nucleoside-diphosphate-sugar epimerase